MRERIIDESIQSLRTEGLRFSVDTLAEKLKISKKTIYKYFPTKEALALAMYEKYYALAQKRADELLETGGADCLTGLLKLYYDARQMIAAEIFNKYKLNEIIRAYTAEQNDRLWKRIAAGMSDTLSDSARDAVRIIVDGAFERLYKMQGDPDAVTERLVRVIC